jgi:hypothetical protein
MLGRYNLDPSMWWEQLPKLLLQRLTRLQPSKCGRTIGTFPHDDFPKEVLFGRGISQCAMGMA